MSRFSEKELRAAGVPDELVDYWLRGSNGKTVVTRLAPLHDLRIDGVPFATVDEVRERRETIEQVLTEGRKTMARARVHLAAAGYLGSAA
jgi:hypothetical protein